MPPLQRVAGAVLFALLVASLLSARDAAAQSQSQPVCIYNSATYSDGAYVCAQKSLILLCQIDGAKATWKTVTDKEINDRCTASVIAPVIREGSRRARRHFVRSQVYAPGKPDPSAKCFNFNGKRYCE